MSRSVFIWVTILKKLTNLKGSISRFFFHQIQKALQYCFFSSFFALHVIPLWPLCPDQLQWKGLQVSSHGPDTWKKEIACVPVWVGMSVALLTSSTLCPSFIHPSRRPLLLCSCCYLSKQRIFSTSVSALSIRHDSHYGLCPREQGRETARQPFSSAALTLIQCWRLAARGEPRGKIIISLGDDAHMCTTRVHLGV